MHSTTVSQWFAQTVAQNPHRKAITFLRKGRVETVLDYGQLGREVESMAARLRGWGVDQGERVIFFLNKSLDAVIAHLAVQEIGAVSIPLNPGFKHSELHYLLNDAQARLVICDSGRRDWIKAIDSHAHVTELPSMSPYEVKSDMVRSMAPVNSIGVDPQAPALIIYTSGTTGNPKGAVLTQQNLTHDATNIISIWDITRDDTLCHALPLFHIHGLCFALHTALLSGAHIVMLDAFDVDKVLEILARKDNVTACTIFMAVPAMYTKIMDRIEAPGGERKPDFHHLRLIASGSAPLSPQTFQRIEKLFGQAPVEREGMSETGMNFSNPLHGKRVLGSIGIPLPGLHVRIVDAHTLNDVAEGEIGEIWLKGPSITPGYWGKPRETREAFQGEWFRTGDLGKRDPDGYYYLTDRIKHIIITGGENVSAKEVESVINGIEGVVDSSVVGVPDPTWGERVVAVVVARPDAQLSEAQIRAVCKKHLHDWKCPKEIKFIDLLPRNTMGKVLKEEVKRQIMQNKTI
jgi:malonyl-CoA/methylmalonyl-CoA synthetase